MRDLARQRQPRYPAGRVVCALALFYAATALYGCAGQAAADPCEAVTCASGRVCVAGRCEPDGIKRDLGPDFSGRRDLGVPPDGRADSLLDGAKDLGGVDGAIDSLAPDTAPPDLATDAPIGRWVATDGVDCTVRCAQLGGLNLPSVPEEAYCMSGEVRVASGIAAGIPFPHGCPSGCVPATGLIRSQSHGKFCYRPGQKKDNDKTDITVGCFCR
jgi:hypothetical protein